MEAPVTLEEPVCPASCLEPRAGLPKPRGPGFEAIDGVPRGVVPQGEEPLGPFPAAKLRVGPVPLGLGVPLPRHATRQYPRLILNQLTLL